MGVKRKRKLGPLEARDVAREKLKAVRSLARSLAFQSATQVKRASPEDVVSLLPLELGFEQPRQLDRGRGEEITIGGGHS